MKSPRPRSSWESQEAEDLKSRFTHRSQDLPDASTAPNVVSIYECGDGQPGTGLYRHGFAEAADEELCSDSGAHTTS